MSRAVRGAAVCRPICNLHLRGWKRAELHSERNWIRLTLRPTKVSCSKALTSELVLGASLDAKSSKRLSEKNRASLRQQRMQKVAKSLLGWPFAKLVVYRKV